MSNSLNKQTKGIFTFIAINDRVTLIIRLSNSGNQFSNRTASPSDSTCFTVSAYFLLHARVFFFFFLFFFGRHNNFFQTSPYLSISMARSELHISTSAIQKSPKDFVSLVLVHNSTIVAMSWGDLDQYPSWNHTVRVGKEQFPPGGAEVQP